MDGALGTSSVKRKEKYNKYTFYRQLDYRLICFGR